MGGGGGRWRGVREDGEGWGLEKIEVSREDGVRGDRGR